MGNKKNYFKSHPITIAQQNYSIRIAFPNFKPVKTNARSKGIWIGHIQPTPLSEIYKVKIEYQQGLSPRVFVLSPTLKRIKKDEGIPHTYPENRPCLFLPRSNEWTDQKYIAETIIPWIAVWLYFYEIWLSTGEWLGEGIHPTNGIKKE